MRAQPQQVVHQTGDFIKQHADVLRAQRHGQSKHFFNRHHIRMLVAHHRHIVQAIHIRQRLNIGFVLSQFFSGAMQQANMRVSALNHFTVQLQHQAQHPVRRWMLRTKVQCIVFNFSHDVLDLSDSVDLVVRFSFVQNLVHAQCVA